ncbi:MAG: hypothetical protein P0Y60_01660 [Candidatus Microbacterium colombiense]|nr:MAG: hypothetical protein P0Y60_01660 [Microbacterium sp.]
MNADITLPRLAGTRAAADALVDSADLRGADEVTVYARAVASAAQSFADEFVRRLDSRGVHHVRLVGSSPRLTDYLVASSKRLGSMTVSTSKVDDLIEH